MLPEAAGRGQHFQARGHSFSLYGPTLSRPITFLSFYSRRKLAHKWVCLRNFAIESAYAPSTIQTICKKSNERTNEQIRYYTKKDVLKNRFIWNYFMLVHLVPQLLVSKTIFPVWNFVQSLKLYSQKQFLSIIANHSTKLDFSTVNWAADSEEIR